MTLNEIKSAVEAGNRVFWGNHDYMVIKDRIGQWLIQNRWNKDCIGLTHVDGVTMNGDPEEFYISN